MSVGGGQDAHATDTAQANRSAGVPPALGNCSYGALLVKLYQLGQTT